MRAPALALILLATPAAAAPHGPGCQLSTAECLQVAREIAGLGVLDLDDEQRYGLGMPDLPTRERLIHRSFNRLKARLARLPRPIAEEIARIRICQAGDNLARAQGIANDDPKCR